MLDRLGPLPADFVFVEGQRGALACRGSDREALLRAGSPPTAGGRAHPRRGGRAEALGRLVVDGTDVVTVHHGVPAGDPGRVSRIPSPLRAAPLERLRGSGSDARIAARAVRAAGAASAVLVIERRQNDRRRSTDRDVRAGRPRRALCAARGGLGRSSGPPPGRVPPRGSPAGQPPRDRAGTRGAVCSTARASPAGAAPGDLASNLGGSGAMSAAANSATARCASGDRALFLESYGVPAGQRGPRLTDRPGRRSRRHRHRLGWWLESRRPRRGRAGPR